MPQDRSLAALPEVYTTNSETFGNVCFSESNVYTNEHELRVHANCNILEHEVLAAQEHGLRRTGRDTRRHL